MLGDRAGHRALEALPESDHVLERVVGQDVGEGGASGGERQGVARQGPADPADVGRDRDRVVGNPLGRSRR